MGMTGNTHIVGVTVLCDLMAPEARWPCDSPGVVNNVDSWAPSLEVLISGSTQGSHSPNVISLLADALLVTRTQAMV